MSKEEAANEKTAKTGMGVSQKRSNSRSMEILQTIGSSSIYTLVC